MNNPLNENAGGGFLVILVTGLVIALLWPLAIAPRQAKFAEDTRRLAEMQKRITDAERLARVTISEDLSRGLGKLASIYATEFVPAGNEYVSMFNLLKEAASTNKVEFRGDLDRPIFGETDLLPNFPYRSASFNALLWGHYDEFQTFLAKLERDHPFMRFQLRSIRFPDAPAPDDPTRMRFDLMIVALVQPPAAPPR